jgi:hypothetical protein
MKKGVPQALRERNTNVTIYSWKFNIILSFRVHIVKRKLSNPSVILILVALGVGDWACCSQIIFFCDFFKFCITEKIIFAPVGERFHFHRPFGIMGAIYE